MDFARSIVTPLASLKLTVFLLILSVIVTFIATLDQTRADVFEVKMKHFSSAFVEVPFQTFLVPRWFPNLQNVPGSFYVPSGLTILILMLMNLSAAHILRFRLQARGAKLIIGIVASIFAGFLTWAVIFNGQNADGFQAKPPISWTQMWMLMQIGLLGLTIGAGFGWFMLDKKRKVERLLLVISGAVVAVGLGITLFLGEQAFIGDSAMRILWQLIQATMAALVAYFACMLLFKRKAGIVLLHLGIAGLMLNEIYVTVTNDEQRMTIFEGQTVSQAIDIRHSEMAIIDVSDPEFDEIVSVPGSRLQNSFQTYLRDPAAAKISSDDLPFDITCVNYIPNSDLANADGSGNPATEGIGQRLKAIELSKAAGTDSDSAVDIASAYVELTGKDGESLGTHLITQNIGEHNSDEVTIDGKSYRIALRFKTNYKPYSLTLVDAQREDYLGTETPRWYSSDVVLNDFDNGIESDQRIWMNNPLRYADETFYQSGMNKLPDGRELSIIQIVRNKGWMIPYVCCMFTVVGLIAQFGNTLLGFLEKSREQEERRIRQRRAVQSVSAEGKLKPPVKSDQNDPTLAELADSADSEAMAIGGWESWIPSLVLVGLLAFWVMGEIRRDRSGQTVQEMRLDLLGQVPVTINGRVQPLDSYARNTARQLSKREKIHDKNDKKQPAIRWLADTLFEADGYDEYRVFRIEDLNILGALELPAAFPAPRDKFRYTLNEMLEAEPELRKLIPDSDKTDSDSWTVFQKRLNTVAIKMQRLYGLKLALGPPDRPDRDLLIKIEDAQEVVKSPLIPLVVPTEDKKDPWVSFSEFKNQAWLSSLAKDLKADTTSKLASAVIAQEIIPQLREDTIRSRIIQGYLSDPEFLKVMSEQHGETDPRVLAGILEDGWDDFPASIKEKLEVQMGPLVDAMIEQQKPRFESMMESQLASINGGSGEIKSSDNELAKMLLKLKPAYLAGDSATFNSTLENYLAKLNGNPPVGMKPHRLSAERTYNMTSPFYFASVFYLTAALAAMIGWVVFRRQFGRAATVLLILGLLIHTFGLVERVIISGRPPITNLYSSVLFVSAAMVALMLVVERITKLGVGHITAGLGAFLALLWAWTMTIVDGDTFTVMVAVLDTQFWLSTHVVCISIGYAATFAAGLLGLGYLIGLLLTPAFNTKESRRNFSNVIYGTVCFGLLCSFFGTVLGGLWGDDSWGRFWGWDPKENGALMIVLWNAVVLHARWGGMVRDRGLASLAILGNVIVLWSWKGVNAMGVGLHAYAGTEDDTVMKMLWLAVAHVVVATLALIPMQFWMSYASEKRSRENIA
jgi:ABC-type transport system involved in cytochrome c biogenesis permease subunit